MSETVTKRHPFRGLLYGIVFGIGLVLLAVGQGWAALGTLPPFILLVVGLVVGTLWGLYAPAKAPKGDPPPERVEVITSTTSPSDDKDTDEPAGDATDEPADHPVGSEAASGDDEPG